MGRLQISEVVGWHSRAAAVPSPAARARIRASCSTAAQLRLLAVSRRPCQHAAHAPTRPCIPPPPPTPAPQEPLLWAWLCHLSLRDIKAYLTETARRELRTENFAVCCAKLAFLPAVIVWQSFVEVTGRPARAARRGSGRERTGRRGAAGVQAAARSAAFWNPRPGAIDDTGAANLAPRTSQVRDKLGAKYQQLLSQQQAARVEALAQAQVGGRPGRGSCAGASCVGGSCVVGGAVQAARMEALAQEQVRKGRGKRGRGERAQQGVPPNGANAVRSGAPDRPLAPFKPPPFAPLARAPQSRALGESVDLDSPAGAALLALAASRQLPLDGNRRPAAGRDYFAPSVASSEADTIGDASERDLPSPLQSTNDLRRRRGGGAAGAAGGRGEGASGGGAAPGRPRRAAAAKGGGGRRAGGGGRGSGGGAAGRARKAAGRGRGLGRWLSYQRVARRLRRFVVRPRGGGAGRLRTPAWPLTRQLPRARAGSLLAAVRSRAGSALGAARPQPRPRSLLAPPFPPSPRPPTPTPLLPSARGPATH